MLHKYPLKDNLKQGESIPPLQGIYITRCIKIGENNEKLLLNIKKKAETKKSIFLYEICLEFFFLLLLIDIFEMVGCLATSKVQFKKK